MDMEVVQKQLERRGLRFKRSNKVIDATKPKVGILGIDTLGKLDYMMKQGYAVEMPERKDKNGRRI